MELIIRYGWMFMMVALVMSLILYFDVLNIDNLFPTRCDFVQDVICVDYKLKTNGELSLLLNNGLPDVIKINNLTLREDENLLTNCVYLGDGLNPYPDLLQGQKKIIFLLCTPNAIDEGDRIDAQLTLHYQNNASKFNHSLNGKLIAEVEI